VPFRTSSWIRLRVPLFSLFSFFRTSKFFVFYTETFSNRAPLSPRYSLLLRGDFFSFSLRPLDLASSNLPPFSHSFTPPPFGYTSPCLFSFDCQCKRDATKKRGTFFFLRLRFFPGPLVFKRPATPFPLFSCHLSHPSPTANVLYQVVGFGTKIPIPFCFSSSPFPLSSHFLFWSVSRRTLL